MKVNKKLWKWSRALHLYAAVALLVLLTFFSFTGITLNHPDMLPGKAQEQDITFQLNSFSPNQGLLFTQSQIQQFEEMLGTRFTQLSIEADGDYALLDAQSPGNFVSGELNLDTGDVSAQLTSFGIWALMNDLHKGRHTNTAWSWIIDITSVLTILFCFSGLVLLLNHRRFVRESMIAGAATLLACIGLIQFM